MTQYIRSIHRKFVYPIGASVVTSITLNRQLWTHDFGAAWDTLRVDEKLIWLAFIANTVCVLTLIELLFLKR